MDSIRALDETILPDGSVVKTWRPAAGVPSVFLSSPVYKWPGHEKWYASMKAAAEYLRNKGIQVVEHYQIGDAMVERARGSLLGTYLLFPRGTFTHHIQIDCDISFHPTSIEAMVRSGKDAIGGGYAFKCDKGDPKWGKPVCRIFGGADAEDLKDPEQPFLVPARYLGGGCTILSDALIRRMVAAYPELYYQSNPDTERGHRVLYTWDLWQSMIIDQPDWPANPGPSGLPVPHTSGRELLSEDYAACERIVRLHERDGGERVICWIDPHVHLSHWVGTTAYDLDYFYDVKKERTVAVDEESVEVVAA